MANIGPFSFPSKGFDAAIFDCDGTLVDSMPVHFEAWCDALALYGAGGVFKEDVFFAMGGRPTMDIVVELNDEYDLRLDPAAVALAKREFFLKRIDLVTLIEEVAAFAESLRGKVPLAIATGGSRFVIEKTLKIVGISDWFDEVVTAEGMSEGFIASLYARVGGIYSMNATNQIALAVTLARTSLHVDGYAEDATLENPFPIAVADSISRSMSITISMRSSSVARPLM